MPTKPSLSMKKSLKALKASQGDQRPHNKKVKKSHFINHCGLIHAQEAFP